MSSSVENLESSLYDTSKAYSVKKVDKITYSNSKNKYFNSSNYLPIITNLRKIDETNPISYISNNSFETPLASSSSLVSSPSSISINNSIECQSGHWPSITKRPSFLRLHLNFHKNKYSPEHKWNSSNQVNESSTESFRYTVSTRQLDNAAKKLPSLHVNPNLIKSFSFHNFNNLRRSSTDANISAFVSKKQRKLSLAHTSSSSLKLTRGVNYSFKRGNYPPFHPPTRNEVNNGASIKNGVIPFDRKEPTTRSETSFTKIYKNLTKRQRLTLLCIMIVSFCSYCSMSILAPFYPKKAEQKGLSETQAGFVFSVFALISVVFSPFLGKLIPIFGAKALILFGILLGGISNLLFGFIENVQDPTFFFALCVAIRIIESFGTCCHSTASYTYIIKVFPEHMGVMFGLSETFVGLGLCLGPGIGSFLYHFGGYKLPFYVFGFIVLLCLPLNWYFLDNIDEEDDSDDDTSSGESLIEIKTTYWNIIKIPKILVICMVIVVMSLAQSYLEPTLEPHLRTTFKLKQEMIGLFFLLGSTSYAISTPVVGYIAAETKNVFVVMIVGTLITLIGLLIIGPSPLIYFASPSIWISTVGLVFISFGHGVAFIPTFEALFRYCIKSGFRDDIKTYSKVSGLWCSLFSLGEFIGPLLGGWAVSISNFQYASTIIALITISTVPFILIMCCHAVDESIEIPTDELYRESGLKTKDLKIARNFIQNSNINLKPDSNHTIKSNEQNA